MTEISVLPSSLREGTYIWRVVSPYGECFGWTGDELAGFEFARKHAERMRIEFFQENQMEFEFEFES